MSFSIESSLFFWVVTLLVINFFRDPSRQNAETNAAIIAPADGKVIEICNSDYPQRFESHKKISIFMNLLNVHVNRSPVAGKILAVDHYPGLFMPANREGSSNLNERTEILIKTSFGMVLVRQVAGLIARRIVCVKYPDEDVDRGERIGIIKFGSRVDVYIPDHVRIECAVGDEVRAGLTRIATVQEESAKS